MSSSAKTLYDQDQRPFRVAEPFKREPSSQFANNRVADFGSALRLKGVPDAAAIEPGAPEWSQTVQIILQVSERISGLQQNSRDAIDGARRVIGEAKSEIEAAQKREQEALGKVAEVTRQLREAEELVLAVRGQLTDATKRADEMKKRAEYAEKLLSQSHQLLMQIYQALPAVKGQDRQTGAR